MTLDAFLWRLGFAGFKTAAAGVHQRIVAAYREPDKKKAREMMQAVIATITIGVPSRLSRSASSAAP